MPLPRTRNTMSAILAITLLASSAASAAPAPSTASPYVTLSVLSGSAVTAEAAAAQDPYETHGSMMPLWIALGVVFAGWAWILLGHDNNNNNNGHHTPISPA